MTSKVALIAKMTLGLAQSVPNAAEMLEAARQRLHEVDPDDGLARVVAERARQIDEEGFSPEQDLRSPDGQLRLAAARYLLHGLDPEIDVILADKWPWSPKWWKPKGLRRDIVRGAALALAAVTRHARLHIPTESDVGALRAELADQLDARGLLAISTREARWTGEEDIIVAKVDDEIVCMHDPKVRPIGPTYAAGMHRPHLPHAQHVEVADRARVRYTSIDGRSCSITVDDELARQVMRAATT